MNDSKPVRPVKKTATKATIKKPLKVIETEVVEVDDRNSAQRIQDVCFEGLIQTYTEKREFGVVEMIMILHGKVLSDRETDV